jgi:hypothetical protein
LSVKAIFIGTIRDTDHAEPSFKDGESFKFDYKQALEFIKKLSITYLGHQDGQTQFEVLWRTVIADFAGGISPANSKYAAEFETCCLQAFRQSSDELTVQNGHDPGFVLGILAMRDLGRLENDDLSTSIDQMNIETEETAEFRQCLLNTMANRRPLISDSGHVGCGNTSLSADDFIVVLAGSPVPFILRRGSGERYQVIGEAYVHGIMFGEEAMNSDTKWKFKILE